MFLDAKQIQSINLIIWKLGLIFRIDRAKVVLIQSRYPSLLNRWLTAEGRQGLERMKSIYSLCQDEQHFKDR